MRVHPLHAHVHVRASGMGEAQLMLNAKGTSVPEGRLNRGRGNGSVRRVPLGLCGKRAARRGRRAAGRSPPAAAGDRGMGTCPLQ